MCELDSVGSGENEMVGFCEHNNEHTHSIIMKKCLGYRPFNKVSYGLIQAQMLM